MIGCSGQASDTASATVTGHVCEIEVTKTPAQTMSAMAPRRVHLQVTNKSDFFTWTGSLSDSVLAHR